MVLPEGFEPPTPWFEARYSIQLSYRSTGSILLETSEDGQVLFGYE